MCCESPLLESRGSVEVEVAVTPTVEDSTEAETTEASAKPSDVVVDAEKEVQNPVTESVQVEQLGRGHRVSQPSTRLRDYVAYNSQCLDKHNTTPALPATPTRSSATVQGTSSYPIFAYVSDAVFSEKHQVFLAAISSEKEPRNFKEAMQYPRFRDTISTEIVALEEQRTWDVTDLPRGKKALSCMWIYKY